MHALQASFHGTYFCMHPFTTSAFACITEWHVLWVRHLCVCTFKVCVHHLCVCTFKVCVRHLCACTFKVCFVCIICVCVILKSALCASFVCVYFQSLLCVHHLCVCTFKVCFVCIFLHCVLYACHFTACACCVLLQNTAETLRRQVKEEIHSRTVLQARINSDTQEIEKTRSESAKKKEKVQETMLCLS